jgi:penicillin-binding protein 2
MIPLQQPDDLRSLRPRLQAWVLLVIVGMLGLLARLFQLQVLEHEHYTRRAERNFVDVVDVEAPRGRIFDINGRTLATNRAAYALYVTARARVVDDAGTGVAGARSERVAITDEAIATIVGSLAFADEADESDLQARIAQLRDSPVDSRYAVAVRGNLSWEEFARIEARMDVLAPWVEIRESAKRYYPEGALTGFVTGQMGNVAASDMERSPHARYRPGDRVGKTGIERQWENYLRGRLGARSRVVDSRLREVSEPPPAALAALPPDKDPIPGQDIYLTLDVELQRAAVAAFEGKNAGALVAMDPNTGRILAMVSVPTVDPNRYEEPIPAADWEAWSRSPLKPFVDKTVQEHFFPGSTYKVVSALAMLEDPEFDPDELIVSERYIEYGGRKFRDTHRCGDTDLRKAIVESCNVYFYRLAIEKGLTLDKMEVIARKLGLGERTGLGINSEVKGRIPTEAFEAREGTYQRGVRLNSAIGQGNVKATVLQMAVVYAAIANGGWVMTPYLVDRIATNAGVTVFESQPQRKNEVSALDPGDRARIHAGLLGVVNDENGTAYSERLADVAVAGKTGTAQVGREGYAKAEDEDELPGWDPTQDHAWFAAYAPAEDPKIVVVCLVVHGGTGADAAAPIAMRVIRHYLDSNFASDPNVRPRVPGTPPPLPGSEIPPPPGGAAGVSPAGEGALPAAIAPQGPPRSGSGGGR